MSIEIPEPVISELNAAGLGGRLIYIPLRRKERSPSELAYAHMLASLKAGKQIDFDRYQNMVSLRTLYRLKQKAIDEYKSQYKE